MNSATFAVPLAFIILSILILWIITGINGKWWLKSLVILITSYFSLAVWLSLNSYMGWPCREPLPDKYQVLWIVVNEPQKEFDGAIYIWLRNLEHHSSHNLFEYQPHSEPRVYFVPYTRELHEQVQKGIESLKQGKVIVGGKKMASGQESQRSDEQANQGSGGDSTNAQQYFWELPPSMQQRKD